MVIMVSAGILFGAGGFARVTEYQAISGVWVQTSKRSGGLYRAMLNSVG